MILNILLALIIHFVIQPLILWFVCKYYGIEINDNDDINNDNDQISLILFIEKN